MEQIVDLILECDKKDLKNMIFPIHVQFGLKVTSNDVLYEFVININDSDKLLVLGSGLINLKQKSKFLNRPLFNRVSWPFDQSTIFYNDPTRYLSDDLRGGFGLGTIDNWYLEEIADIIKLIANKLYAYKNTENSYNNVIFFGSSQGGYMSLQLATLIKNSIAIAEIPQINLFNMIYFNQTLKKIIFPNISDEELKEKILHRLDIVELIKKEKYIPNAYLILDCSCEGDFLIQYKLLFDRLNELPYVDNNNVNKIRVRIDGKNKGHEQMDYLSLYRTIENISLLIDTEYENRNQLIVKNWFFKRLNLNQQEALLKYAKARIDFKNVGTKDNSIELVYKSDPEALVFEPNFLQTETGKGFVIESLKGSMDLEIKCINDGILEINLRGIYFKGLDSKTFPIHIDFYKLEINETTVFNQKIRVWHNKPYTHIQKVKNNESIKIHLEWMPIDNRDLILDLNPIYPKSGSYTFPVAHNTNIVKEENQKLQTSERQVKDYKNNTDKS